MTTRSWLVNPPPPPRNNGLIRPFQGKPIFIKNWSWGRLFLGGHVRGGWLIIHNTWFAIITWNNPKNWRNPGHHQGTNATCHFWAARFSHVTVGPYGGPRNTTCFGTNPLNSNPTPPNNNQSLVAVGTQRFRRKVSYAVILVMEKGTNSRHTSVWWIKNKLLGIGERETYIGDPILSTDKN